MDVNEDALRKHYQQLPDEDIEHLAKYEANDLVPEAQNILKEEIRRRGLSDELYNLADVKSKVDPEVESKGDPEVEYINLVNIETYSDRHEAELAKGILSVN